jgi:hypothetical protein
MAGQVVRFEERAREREELRERESRGRSSLSLTKLHARRRRPLQLSERVLVVWLREKLRTAGATAMVREYGARAVLDALYDGVVCEEAVMEERAVGTGRSWGDGAPVQTYRLVEVGRRRVVSPQLRSPGGFLRRLLDGSL